MLPSVHVHCPYCGEPLQLSIDDSAGDQRYIEDCQVCCQPIAVIVTITDNGDIDVACRAENDA